MLPRVKYNKNRYLLVTAGLLFHSAIQYVQLYNERSIYRLPEQSQRRDHAAAPKSTMTLVERRLQQTLSAAAPRQAAVPCARGLWLCAVQLQKVSVSDVVRAPRRQR